MRAPIFIIGYPRSGTSFVGKLIAQFTGYPSHGESHTLTLLQELHHQINLYRRRTDFTGKELVKQLDMQALKELNTSFFRDFYLKTYGSECFIDKTPGAVACHGWGVVKEAFPNAVFLACVRSPVEVFQSAVAKFGNREGHSGVTVTDPGMVAKGWVAAMNGINNLASSAFSQDLYIVSQLELRSNPASEADKILSFLDVTIDEHRGLQEFCESSREDVLTDSIKRPTYKPLKDLNMNSQEAKLFRDICESTCKEWGIPL